MKIQILKSLIIILLLILSMLYGMLSYSNKLPPYNLIQYFFGNKSTSEIRYPDYYTDTEVNDLISIRQTTDVDTVRSKLIKFLWGTALPMYTYPIHVDENIVDERYRNIPYLSKIDRIIVNMEFDLESQVYYFYPTSPINKAILYHQGHEGDFYNGKANISQFLENGFAVMAFSMPLLGPNSKPILELPHIGKLKLAWHDQMKFLSPPQGHPIKYFVEPVIIGLNYLEKKDSYKLIAMTGISGGGWTTTLAAAIDPRINLSFPVAGSYPIYLRSEEYRDWGDWEQTEPQLYKTVNYLELYTLGAYGEGRKQLQIINQFDSCCFAGTKWQFYKDIVRQRVYELGAGEFDLFLDNTHQEHIISDTAMNEILRQLEGQ